MEIKTLLDKPTNFSRKLSETKTSNVYLLDDNKTVFKEFKPDGNLKVIHHLHPNFPKYIEYLESLKNNSLLIPETIYVKNKRGKVDSYEYTYLDGMPIYKLPPKTNFKKLLKALPPFLSDVQALDCDLILIDAHIGNILYTGKCLKLIDVDFFHKPKFSQMDIPNLLIINRRILDFLFDEDTMRFIYNHEELRELYDEAYNGTNCLYELLDYLMTYLELLNESEVEYIRDIRGKQLVK